MTDTQAAYLAGFFDGEGSITARIEASGGSLSMNVRLRIVISQKDRTPLDWIVTTFGAGVVNDRGNHTPEWHLCGRRNVLRFIATVYPYSIVKKAQLDCALELFQLLTGPRGRGQRVPDEEWQSRYQLIDKLGDLKNSGRPRRRYSDHVGPPPAPKILDSF